MPEPADPFPPALAGAISTPRKAVGPMWMVPLALPAMIWEAIDVALLIGMAKPTLEPVRKRRAPDAAVFIPMTSPAELANGPPESPGRRTALVSSRPVRFSDGRRGSRRGSPG